MTQPFDRGNRGYYVSDEGLRAFRQLTIEQRLRWVEELAAFLRLAKAGRNSLNGSQDEGGSSGHL
ncbi:MAG: hypothetical protein ACRER2_18640 [Methylococcales bacterium]